MAPTSEEEQERWDRSHCGICNADLPRGRIYERRVVGELPALRIIVYPILHLCPACYQELPNWQYRIRTSNDA